MDLSFDLSPKGRLMPPLPQQLLGLDPTLNLTMNSFRPTNDDKLILLSRSSIPSQIYNLSQKQLTLDGISKILSQDDQDLPFWLGLFSPSAGRHDTSFGHL